MPLTKSDIDDVFTYHAPDAEQATALATVREKARELAHVIVDEVPPCADQQAALRLLREAVMTANAGIILRGKV